MCSLNIECVLLLQNVFSYYGICSLATGGGRGSRRVVLTAGERGVSLTKALSYLASMPSTVENTFYREHIL